jgi:hypothetical protein
MSRSRAGGGRIEARFENRFETRGEALTDEMGRRAGVIAPLCIECRSTVLTLARRDRLPSKASAEGVDDSN